MGSDGIGHVERRKNDEASQEGKGDQNKWGKKKAKEKVKILFGEKC